MMSAEMADTLGWLAAKPGRVLAAPGGALVMAALIVLMVDPDDGRRVSKTGETINRQRALGAALRRRWVLPTDNPGEFRISDRGRAALAGNVPRAPGRPSHGKA